MKKIIASAACAAIIMSAASISAAAEVDTKGFDLPFEAEKPANTALGWLDGGDSPTTMKITYSMGGSMNEWLSAAADPATHDATMEKLSKENGIDDLYVSAQIDWAIDDPENGWHWTKYWDGEIVKTEDREEWTGYGYDKDYQVRTGDWDILDGWAYPQKINDCWILRGGLVNDTTEWFYGTDLKPGVKDQLKEDQYTLEDTDSEDNEKLLVIDWTKHTAYVRVRWAITATKIENDTTITRPIFSEWSEISSFGKDAAEAVSYTKDDIKPPVITGLEYYPDEFNGYPQISCTLTVPAELEKALTSINARGGDIRVEFEARVPDGEWVGLQGDLTITSGKMVFALQNLAESLIGEDGEKSGVILEKGSPVELRARYFVMDDTEDFYSDYSDVLTFGTEELSAPEKVSAAEESKASDESQTSEKNEQEKSNPLIIIIIIIVLLIIIIIIVIIIISKKKKDKKN